MNELNQAPVKKSPKKCVVVTNLRNEVRSAPEELFDLSKPATPSVLHYSIVVEL